MGSLYDIGNFRYKHFTFYGCTTDGEGCHIHTGDETYDSEGNLVEENLAKKIHHDVQIKNYLNAVCCGKVFMDLVQRVTMLM